MNKALQLRIAKLGAFALGHSGTGQDLQADEEQQIVSARLIDLGLARREVVLLDRRVCG